MNQQSSPILSGAQIPVPKIKDGKLKTEAVRSWNTRNLGLRLGADATSAATASLLVAPVICVIDQYVPGLHELAGRLTEPGQSSAKQRQE